MSDQHPTGATASDGLDAQSTPLQLTSLRGALFNRELIARRCRQEADALRVRLDGLRQTLERAESERERLHVEIDDLRLQNAALRAHNDELAAAYRTTAADLEQVTDRLGYRVLDRFASALRRRPLLWRMTRSTARGLTGR